MPKLCFVDFHWTPPSMVARRLRSSCFNQTVRCSSRRVSCPQRQGLVYTQHHSDINQAYKTTTIRADAQEIVYPMPKLCFVDFHWTPPSMVARRLRSSCFNQTVRCSSRRVSCPQRQGLVYTQHHSDINQAYKTTTIRADAQEIVYPMPKLCFVDFHWTPPSMGVNQPPSQCSANAIGYSSRRVRLAQTHS